MSGISLLRHVTWMTPAEIVWREWSGVEWAPIGWVLIKSGRLVRCRFSFLWRGLAFEKGCCVLLQRSRMDFVVNCRSWGNPSKNNLKRPLYCASQKGWANWWGRQSLRGIGFITMWKTFNFNCVKATIKDIWTESHHQLRLYLKPKNIFMFYRQPFFTCVIDSKIRENRRYTLTIFCVYNWSGRSQATGQRLQFCTRILYSRKSILGCLMKAHHIIDTNPYTFHFRLY